MRRAATLALILAATPAFADATVTDGDTIKLDGTTYRLWGVDAMEGRQLCVDGWRGGAEAGRALAAMLAGKTVTCEPRSTDRYGRTVAICRANGVDLGAAMVRAGHALAFTRYSADYLPQEAEARAARVGVHAHDCMPAWEWRALQKR